MNIKEIERVVASIQHTVFRNANSISAGAMRSRFRGAGLQFREHQVYNHGDDVRFIDWKVSARTSNIYLKTFEEDRNVEICVLLDVSPTSFYGSNGVTKAQMSFEICALLFLLAHETHDRIRIQIFCENEKFEMPPKKGREGLTHFISLLERLKILSEGGSVNLKKQFELRENSGSAMLAEIKKHLSRKKEVIYLGDMTSLMTVPDFSRISDDSHFHGVRLISPVDLNPLKFSIKSGANSTVGLGKPSALNDKLKRFPAISSSERYLELFLRRMR